MVLLGDIQGDKARRQAYLGLDDLSACILDALCQSLQLRGRQRDAGRRLRTTPPPLSAARLGAAGTQPSMPQELVSNT